ncbi:MAG TPA: MlaD family protein [Vicinamibacterales bacterium]|jgi:phospholipid/cholesterol/gamma-HCH transport system substrate-binding protein|nr:MlaD family protein [Vicinamibacterales bacterium]
MISSKLVGAGAFVVFGILLFTIALFMIGERRMLFEKRFPVYAEFAKLGQLEQGAAVRVAGLDAGEVTEIQIPGSPAGKFRVKMEVREDLHGLVRTDSVANVQMEGLVGAIFVNIASGSETAQPVPPGGTIKSREPFSMADLMEQASGTITLISMTVESLRGDVETAVKQIALTAEDAHAIVEDVRPDITAIARTANRLSADAQEIADKIQNGEGTIGKLINDDTLYRRAQEIADNAKDVMANVREVSDEARRAVADFRSKDGPAQGLMADMRVTIGQAREAVADLADNMEALKHNFLLRGFFNKRGYFDLDRLSPAEYRKGVLENGKRKALRIWLASSVLFERSPDGTEGLSDGGKARLDSAMATYLEYVPSYPIVIEGYATDGLSQERFRTGRRRAGMVREYLMGRYDLVPQATGFIALDRKAEGSPNGSSWDGVAIALFIDKEALRFDAPDLKPQKTSGVKPQASGLSQAEGKPDR